MNFILFFKMVLLDFDREKKKQYMIALSILIKQATKAVFSSVCVVELMWYAKTLQETLCSSLVVSHNLVMYVSFICMR